MNYSTFDFENTSKMNEFQTWLITSSEDFQFILYFGLLFLLMVIEQFAHFRSIERKGRWLTNFALTIIAIITMFSIPVTFISSAGYAEHEQWGLLNMIHSHWAIVLLLALLVRSFISFFTHYLAHRVPFIWRIHRVHHLDTALDVTTNVRFHPFEFLVNSIIGVPIILLAGLPVWTLMLYELLDVAITLISHANISLPHKAERLLRYIVVTPDLHRVHHSSHQPETDSNFGAVFPLWDIIFKTFRTKTVVSPDEMEIGLKEIRDERTTNLWWLLLSPFKNFKK
jgi:sterol desaturase/sphingolipid hydroxylase (fatty acid hydroxylase superfamily)